MTNKIIRIGTRESQLAVWQATQVKSLLEKYGFASTPMISIGCSVISHASSGVWQRSKNPYFSRNTIYSGKYRPAWRIIHTGGRSTVSPFNVRSKRSFFKMLMFY